MSAPYGATDHDLWDTWFAEQGAAYLLDTKRKERPFFLMVSLYAPHSPFHFPVEFRGRQDPARFEVPRVGPEDDDQIPAIFRDLTEQEKRGIAAAYYTSTEWMDKNMGLVLEALKRSGLAENTIVVYLGDHGYCLGHHGRFEKHCSYEQAARAPLLIRYPGRIEPGSSNEALVEFIDVVPTLLEYCGRAVPERVQGRSLVRVLEGATASHREQVFVEYAWADEIMVRDGRWKLVFIRGKRERPDGYATGRPLPGHTLKLFDLQNDPDEFTNLATRPEHSERVRRCLGLLADHVKRTSRHPELIPVSDDPLVVLDYCAQPHDDLPAGEIP
jgi:choline-sulfatase